MENNGKGIFYGVIGVATLVVAIIGATFAFFAAGVNGNTGVIQAGAANVSGTLKLSEVIDARTNMIPVTEEVMQASYAQTGATKGASGYDKCAGFSAAGGDTPYNLCSTYTFTITNEASIDQTVYISLKSESNTFTNLWYALYDGDTLVQNTKATGVGSLQSNGTAQGTDSAHGTFKIAPTSTGTDENITNTLLAKTNGSKTYTLVLYIHELGGLNGDQTTDDSGKSYTGTILVSSSDGSANITGQVRVQGQA